MDKKIASILKESIDVKQSMLRSQKAPIEKACRQMIRCLKKGGKVILFGNGGSAADCQHIAGELLGRFMMNRRALPAIALTVNTSVLTAISNDFGYDSSFSKQLEALGKKGDIAIAISTSGNSKNVTDAVKKAKKMKLVTIGFSGGNGGSLSRLVDIPIVVPSRSTPRIQESHITIGHAICEIVEQALFSSKKRR
jgi:D-sedoheptulose 7-phosphate isomerase